MLIWPSAVDRFRPRSITRAGRLRRPLIASAAQERGNLLVHRTLQDQTSSQSAQLRQVLTPLTQPFRQLILDLQLEPNARRDSRYSFHLA